MPPSTMNKECEREFILECIRLYRELPSLWDLKSKEYHDRKKKNQSYDVLLAKYREMYPDATKDDLKKKLNTLRTNYRKEMKKYVSAVQAGGLPTLYEPTLWYYNEMDFLRDDDLESDSSLGNVSQHSTVCYLESEEGSDSPDLSSNENEIEDIEIPRKKSRKNEQLLSLAYECLTDKNDEYYHWAMVCASDLRKMDTTQQLYAKKAISDIIMEGQLGLLHRNSVKINEGLTQFF